VATAENVIVEIYSIGLLLDYLFSIEDDVTVILKK
jgi:hypothetical protein